jgi:hypothetical protein
MQQYIRNAKFYLGYNSINKCTIWGSHNSGYEEYYLLGYNVMYFVEIQQTFWRNMSLKLTTCFHVGVLVGLFFDPKYGGDMFLQNVGWLSTDYTALYPRR